METAARFHDYNGHKHMLPSTGAPIMAGWQLWIASHFQHYVVRPMHYYLALEDHQFLSEK